MNEKNLALAIQLRHELHEHPELSMQEVWTKKHIIDFLQKNTNLTIVDKGLWFYAIYRAGEHAKNIAFRADFDGVPVQETCDVPYASKFPGMGHKCGHDGHSACLALFAMEVSEHGSDKNVYFLFQPANENGEGALLCKELITEHNIEEIYGYHNRPGFEQGVIAIKNGTMNCASKGMIIHMVGKSAHASMPETGKNPSFAIAEIIRSIPTFIKDEKYKGIILCTIICVQIGEEAFGVSASDGKLMLTLRGQIEAEMNDLQSKVETLAKKEAEKYGLSVEFSFTDAYPETANQPWGADKVRAVCKAKNIPLKEMEIPSRDSEDYGHYLKMIPGAYFYVGVGEDYAPLHSGDLDFNDNIIPRVVEVFTALLEA